MIDEADAKRVAKVVISDFEAVLGNGHSNGKAGTGYALIGESGNGSGNTSLIEGPRVDGGPLLSSSMPGSMELTFKDDGPSSFTDK